MEAVDLKSVKHVHFIGVGGVSTSALAEYLFSIGKEVSGSEIAGSDYLNRLIRLGIKIFRTHSAKNIAGADLIVYTSAISEQNAELKGARNSLAKVISRGELLGQILSEYGKSIAVSGSHGKTTTSFMIAEILKKYNLNPTAFIGGRGKGFSNFLNGEKEYCVCEACEYKKNFLYLKPFISVVLNIDNDHLESYGSMENIIFAFNEFVSNSIAFVNANDVNAKGLSPKTKISFGVNCNANYVAKNLRKNKRGYSFSVYVNGVKGVKISLKVAGEHNVQNAVCAYAVCHYLGVPESVIKAGLESFLGVYRRLEKIGNIRGLEAFADYAHHPNEVSAFIKAFGADEKTLIVFQPHTYSRTKNLLKEFTDVLSKAKNLIIFKTYPAREEFDACASAKTLYYSIKSNGQSNVKYVESEAKLLKQIQNFASKTPCGRVAFVGAGDIYEIAKKML